MTARSDYEAIVIGGGFYGCCLALFLDRYCESVALLEMGEDLLTRASYVNQARVHGGYHYPRSFMTALRSFVNFPRFCLDFRECIEQRFKKVYAIARNNSKVNAFQFTNFCKRIGAQVKPAPRTIRQLFNTAMIEDVFCVKEYAFDALKLRQILKDRLQRAGIDVHLNSAVCRVTRQHEESLEVLLKDGHRFRTKQVLNCTYANINTLLRDSDLALLPLKHEVTEIALIEVPDELKSLGITVMDGPFFSTLPFPAQGTHSLSHVRYTPHEYWHDAEQYKGAYQYLRDLQIRSNFVFMLRDAQRYVPLLSKAKYIDSLFEIKTVLTQNEIDDGRPILLRQDPRLKNMTTVMGGKIDNIYDVLQALKGLGQYSRELR